MDETKAMMGILLIAAISATAYFVLEQGASGAASQPYITCCCNILAEQGYARDTQQALFRSQIQTYEADCNTACQYYKGQGTIFAQGGTCAENQ